MIEYINDRTMKVLLIIMDEDLEQYLSFLIHKPKKRERKVIASVITMFDLTIEGIEEAMNYLRKDGKDGIQQFTR